MSVDMLEGLFTNAVAFKYSLDEKSNPKRTLFSNVDDDCFECLSDEILAKLIYNGVLDYAYGQGDINPLDENDFFESAFNHRLRFNHFAEETTKLSYGFYGEILLHVFLRYFYGTDCAISKGHFYNPLDKRETTGYDSYHIIERDGNLELWFGEAKFHKTHSSAINSVMKNIGKTISDEYLNTNLIAISKHSFNMNNCGAVLKSVVERLKNKPSIVLVDEIKNINAQLVYPVLIAYTGPNQDFDACVGKARQYIDDQHVNFGFDNSKLSIPLSIFFVFLPVKDSMKIKKVVLKWIASKEPRI